MIRSEPSEQMIDAYRQLHIYLERELGNITPSSRYPDVCDYSDYDRACEGYVAIGRLVEAGASANRIVYSWVSRDHLNIT